jgi:hypothetical protein
VVVVGGSLGTVYTTLGDPIWFHVPWDLARGLLVYELGGWLVLALCLAAALPDAERPPAAAPTRPSRRG